MLRLFHPYPLPRFLSLRLPYGKLPAVDLADLIAQAFGHAGNVGAGHNAVIDFFFQPVDLLLGRAVLVGAVEVVIRTVMNDY